MWRMIRGFKSLSLKAFSHQTSGIFFFHLFEAVIKFVVWKFAFCLFLVHNFLLLWQAVVQAVSFKLSFIFSQYFLLRTGARCLVVNIRYKKIEIICWTESQARCIFVFHRRAQRDKGLTEIQTELGQ